MREREPKTQIFADSPLLLEIQALMKWRAQEAAVDRRFSQKTEDFFLQKAAD